MCASGYALPSKAAEQPLQHPLCQERKHDFSSRTRNYDPPTGSTARTESVSPDAAGIVGPGELLGYSAPMQSLFFQTLGPGLALFHAVSAMVLCGSSVHLAVWSYRALRGRKIPRASVRLHAGLTAVTYLLTGVFGWMLYPRYRILVRGRFLDRCAPWAANLFDFKENLATLLGPLVLGALLLAYSITAKPGVNPPETQVGDPGHAATNDRAALWTFFAMATGNALGCLFNLFCGLVVTAQRGV